MLISFLALVVVTISVLVVKVFNCNISVIIKNFVIIIFVLNFNSSFHFKTHETIFHICYELAIFIICNFSIIHPHSDNRNLFIRCYVGVEDIFITLSCMECSGWNIYRSVRLWVKPRSSTLYTD